MTGIRLTGHAQEEWSDNVVGFEFDSTDIELDARVKTMSLLDFAAAKVLVHRAKTSEEFMRQRGAQPVRARAVFVLLDPRSRAAGLEIRRAIADARAFAGRHGSICLRSPARLVCAHVRIRTPR